MSLIPSCVKILSQKCAGDMAHLHIAKCSAVEHASRPRSMAGGRAAVSANNYVLIKTQCLTK